MTKEEDKRFLHIIDGDYSDFSEEAEVLCAMVRELHEKLEQQKDPVRESLGEKISQLPASDVISAGVVAFGVGPLVLSFFVWLFSAGWVAGDVTGYYIENKKEHDFTCSKVVAQKAWWPDKYATGCLESWEALSYLRQIERMEYDVDTRIDSPPERPVFHYSGEDAVLP